MLLRNWISEFRKSILNANKRTLCIERIAKFSTAGPEESNETAIHRLDADREPTLDNVPTANWADWDCRDC